MPRARARRRNPRSAHASKDSPTRYSAPTREPIMAEREAHSEPTAAPRARRPEPPRPEIRKSFTRGKARPRGVVWFGVTSFWGHLQHFLATAIATEDVDSRDWMTPDEPGELLGRIARELGGDQAAASLVEALGRDVWID